MFVLKCVGEAYDNGMTAAELAAKKAALKKAAEDEKMREWQAARANAAK